MKKNILLALISLVSLSCSRNDDDEPVVDNTPILVTKVIDNGEVANYKYDGNKITEASTADGLYKAVFTYTGNLITQIKYFENGITTETTDFTYDGSEKLTFAKKVGITSGSNTPNSNTYNYTYPNATTVVCTEVYTYVSSGTTVTNKDVNTYTIKNGNIVSLQSNYYFNNVLAGNISHTYTIDDKNSPFVNILGADKLLIFDGYSIFDSAATPGKNNWTKISATNTPVGSSTTSYSTVFTNTYNGDNYPTQIVQQQYNSSNTPQGTPYTTNYIYNK